MALSAYASQCRPLSQMVILMSAVHQTDSQLRILWTGMRLDLDERRTGQKDGQSLTPLCRSMLPYASSQLSPRILW